MESIGTIFLGKEREMTNLLQMKNYFGFESMKQFRNEWQELSEESKKELREGIENGSLTY